MSPALGAAAVQNQFGECVACGGTGFVIVEGPRGSGAKKCQCRQESEANSWASRRLAELKSGPPLTLQAALAVANGMGIIPFYPSGCMERAAIASQLMRMCSTWAEAKYVGRRAVEICRDWSKGGGVIMLRQILATVTTAKDGIVVPLTSSVFPDGLPSDAPPEALPPAPGQFRELPRGDMRLLGAGDISVDSELQRELIATAQSKEMDRRLVVIQPPLRRRPASEPMSEERRKEIALKLVEAELELKRRKAANEG